MAYETAEDEKKLVYDLRQIYAKIVGMILERIAMYREIDDYLNYYKALNDLRLEVMKNLGEKEREKIKTARDNLLKTLEEHESVLTKSNTDGKERSLVAEALGDYEILLKDFMEKKDMYGAKYDDSGL